MPVSGVLPAWPGAFALGVTRGFEGYARSPQPLPVGARSSSSGPRPIGCAANAVEVANASNTAACTAERTSLRIANPLDCHSPECRMACRDALGVEQGVGG